MEALAVIITSMGSRQRHLVDDLRSQEKHRTGLTFCTSKSYFTFFYHYNKSLSTLCMTFKHLFRNLKKRCEIYKVHTECLISC